MDSHFFLLGDCYNCSPHFCLQPDAASLFRNSSSSHINTIIHYRGERMTNGSCCKWKEW